jgi:hypothetical protein
VGGRPPRLYVPHNLRDPSAPPTPLQQQTLRDGTVRTAARGPDPRFGMQAPATELLQEETPGWFAPRGRVHV